MKKETLKSKKVVQCGGKTFGLSWTLLAVLGLTLLALLVRVMFLGKAGYHIDEAGFTREAMAASGYAEIYVTELKRIAQFHHLPMVKMLMRAAVSTIGFEGHFPPEWVPRLPFALLGAATVPLIFLMVRALTGNTAGLWAAFLATFSIFHVYHSRDAYDYALLIFFVPGVFWTSFRLLQEWLERERFRWSYAVGYMIFSTGFLESHLTALLFLAPWNLLMSIMLLADSRSRQQLLSPTLFKWGVTLGVSYLVLSPFLVQLLTHGYSDVEQQAGIPNLFVILHSVVGCMGWGESFWALIPFVVVLLLGVWFGWRGTAAVSRRLLGMALLLGLVFFVVQTLALSKARFEVRYFSPLFPLFMLLAGTGLTSLGRAAAAKLNKPPLLLHGLAVGALVLWLAPSVWCLWMLESHLIWNYKPTAAWINRNMPENSIYCLDNNWHLSMIPSVYPTPGRFPEFISIGQTNRLVSFFTRFPLACYAQFSMGSASSTEKPRDEEEARKISEKMSLLTSLFVNRRWIRDLYWQRLVSLRTNPLGTYKRSNRVGDHVLISWNRQKDLPALATQRGDLAYHFFGPEWQYTRDRRGRGWRVMRRTGTLMVGNVSQDEIDVVLHLTVAAIPETGGLTVHGPGGETLLAATPVEPRATDIETSAFTVPPGVHPVRLRFSSSGQKGRGALLVHSALPRLVTAEGKRVDRQD